MSTAPSPSQGPSSPAAGFATAAPSVMPSTEQPPLPTPSSTGASDQRPSIPPEHLKPNACVSCQRRKVKCDRTEPCSSCKRYRTHCEFRDPAPRRKRKYSEEDLHAKLDRYESLLNSFGARVDSKPEAGSASGPVSTPSSAFTPLNAARANGAQTEPVSRSRDVALTASSPLASAQNANPGRLVFDKGSSRYIESTLWKGLSDQFKDPKEMLQEPPNGQQSRQAPASASSSYQLDEGEFVFGLSQGHPTSLRSLHPQSAQIFLLWQAFLDNVNPLTKLLHAPTVQRQILQACSNLEEVSKELEALMFAIYHFAVVSMPPEECQATLGANKSTLLSKFQYATKLALMRAGFLKSTELVVLQAYVLYLLAMRQYYDVQTLWSLSGIAVRMAQRIGLHRDGKRLGLPFFDVELRRRLTWQVLPLDARTAEISGANASVLNRVWDKELPLNVNDSELNPDMKQLPVEHTGPTEMFFCLLRYQFGKTMTASAFWSHEEFPADKPEVAKASIAEKDRLIDELEQVLEEKFLKHCDASIPLHYLTAIVARCALSVMRLRAHHPRQYSDKGASLPQAEKDLLFSMSLRMVELDVLAQSEKALQRFIWHMNASFQWDGIVVLLSELCQRTSGKDVDKAWFQVNKCFEHHPEIASNQSNPLHLGVCNLVRKAWRIWTGDLKRRGCPLPERGTFPALESLLADSTAPPTSRDGASSRKTGSGSLYQQLNSAAEDASGSLNEQSPMDWALWDDLLQGWGLQVPLENAGFFG